MIEIKESSFIIVVVDQFVDNSDRKSNNTTDDLMDMLKLVPFTSTSDRPIYTLQQRDIARVRTKLNEQNYILTTAYQTATNIMYSCKRTEIDKKIFDYMKQTKAYSIIYEFNENDQHDRQIFLDLLCQQVKEQLDVLYDHQCINSIQYSLLNINRSNVQLDQLCFVPDLRKYDIPFEPMMISFCGLTTNMAQYLHRLLAPIYYDQIARRQTTFFQGSDAIHAVQLYCRQGLLRPNTLFATIDINNLCTLFSHSHTMELLERFLNDYIPNGHIQGLSIRTILQLVDFILSHQYFIYQNKLYRQTKGGPSNLPFTNLLANIYMFYWQKKFVHLLHNQKEIFGRYLNQIFFTWNKSKVELVNLINDIGHNQFDSLQLISTIGTTINYMDAEISHMNGVLQTKVFHQCPFEPYCLPYLIDHPPYQYLTLIRASLLRAVRCCSNVHDFGIELNFIRLSFLLNHFSFNYIKQCFDLFNQEFKFKWKSFHYCQHDYDYLRERIRKYDQRHCKTTWIQQGSQVLTYDLIELEGSLVHRKLEKDLKRRRQNQWHCVPSCKRIKTYHR